MDILEKLGSAMTGYETAYGLPTMDRLLRDAAKEITRQDSLIGELQAHNARLIGLISEAVEDMGIGGRCVHAGLKGRMVQAVTPNAAPQPAAGNEATGDEDDERNRNR